MSESFAYIKTGGSAREMGFDMGRAVAENLDGMRVDTERHYRKATGRSFESLTSFAEKQFLKLVARRYPRYLEEVRGIAEGAGMEFADLFFLTVDEEMSSLFAKIGKDHCSSAVVRRGGRWLLAHNEDYPPRYFGRMAIVDAKPDDAPAFLALTYPYILGGASCGVNSAGLAFTANSLRFPAKSNGLPTNYILRDMYGARSLDEAERRVAQVDALMANSSVVVSGSENIACAFELSPYGIVAIHSDSSGTVTHTNHMIGGSPSHRLGERPTPSSKARYKALSKEISNVRSVTGLERLFSSDKKGLFVVPRGSSESCTIATAVVDVAERTMYVAERGPGAHGFKSYRMRR